ncbi:transcriptional regulator [Aliishimia ponticola]|uniref:Transcriptional regulator n=1 Tax=Aliishimia ponticola TaxID=2499833 RepID=A0A4S4NBQ5_9RHOB|nr:ChrR family anti-sigma-E factor [Aliishimia ponticola]THH36769.1 transcriptional regulator [Aliishimia ponticola]
MVEKIKHHLTPEILMAYAAGTLPEAFNLMVASHLSLCDTCRAEAASYDALGGAVLEDTIAAPMDMASDSLEATMARIAAGPVQERAAPGPSDSILPAPLRDYIGGDLDQIRWRPVGMGVKQAILTTSRSATARMLYIPAGTAMPDHGHKGTELTMVLQGAFADEDEYFGRGDVETADTDTQHTPVADIHEDCICLAVTDAPLRFTGIIPRLIQPLLRI